MTSALRQHAVIIVGAGFGGLAAALALRRDGCDDFVILEKSQSVGGTWRDNTYPGCACDVPSSLYTFADLPPGSFARRYGRQPEILSYLQMVAAQHLEPTQLRLGTELLSARFDPETNGWDVTLAGGERLSGRHLVLAGGMLSVPNRPAMAGLSKFQGEVIHSSQWPQALDLTGKRVAVIGTGASAVQIIPAIAAEVAQLHVLQRTAAWIIPKRDRAVAGTASQKAGGGRLQRWREFLRMEIRGLALGDMPMLMAAGRWRARQHLGAQITDPDLRARLTPTTPMGCMRILQSDDYYPAFNRSNVHLHTVGIEQTNEANLELANGDRIDLDILILATGFEPFGALKRLNITGVNGASFAAAVAPSPRAYYGLLVPEFPNLFLIGGPNTGLAHNSLVLMFEAQAKAMTALVKKAKGIVGGQVSVSRDACQRYNDWLDQRLKRFVFAGPGCRSWYRDASGHVPTLWPGGPLDYARRLQMALSEVTIS